MTIVLVHGAGSTAAAARALLGPLLAGRDCVALDDRTGDIDVLTARLGQVADDTAGITHVVGISLGAHAVARWASETSVSDVRLVLVLPAWTGPPDASAVLTERAAAEVRTTGIARTLARIRQDSDADDVARLLEVAWRDYADADLVNALEAAACSSAPDEDALAGIPAPSMIIGWEGDPLHPSATVRHWARVVPRARVAMAARPSVELLRAGIGAATGWPGRPARPPSAGT